MRSGGVVGREECSEAEGVEEGGEGVGGAGGRVCDAGGAAEAGGGCDGGGDARGTGVGRRFEAEDAAYLRS